MNKSLIAPPLSPTTSTKAQARSPTTYVRLPDVKLPVFNGTLEHWLNFHDFYISLVHSSQDLCSLQKFYYVRSCNPLVEHIQNTGRLKSAGELYTFVKRFEANVRILQQLGEQTNTWDIILVRMLSSRLDQTTRRDWEGHSSTLQDRKCIAENGSEQHSLYMCPTFSKMTRMLFCHRTILQRKRVSIPIAGIGHSTTQTRTKFTSTIRSQISDFSASAEFHVLPEVTINLPSPSLDISSWKIPSVAKLADPSFSASKTIDLVLGAEICFDLFV